MKLICYQEDIPSAPTTDTVHFVLSFEGGRPLEGRIENLRNFYCLGLRAMQITWNLRNELADGVKAHERLAGRTAFAGEVGTPVRVFAGSVVDIAGWVPRALWEEN